MKKVLNFITCHSFNNPFYVLNGLYFNAFLLLLIMASFSSIILKNIGLSNQLFEFSIYSFLVLILNTAVMAVYVTLTKRKYLMEEKIEETTSSRGKTPLKILADEIAKGMVKNLNSGYQSKH